VQLFEDVTGVWFFNHSVFDYTIMQQTYEQLTVSNGDKKIN